MRVIDRNTSAMTDRNRVTREFGGGGMSRVFVAEETALGRTVVIKVLPPETAGAAGAWIVRQLAPASASLRHHAVQAHALSAR